MGKEEWEGEADRAKKGEYNVGEGDTRRKPPADGLRVYDGHATVTQHSSALDHHQPAGLVHAACASTKRFGGWGGWHGAE